MRKEVTMDFLKEYVVANESIESDSLTVKFGSLTGYYFGPELFDELLEEKIKLKLINSSLYNCSFELLKEIGLGEIMPYINNVLFDNCVFDNINFDSKIVSCDFYNCNFINNSFRNKKSMHNDFVKCCFKNAIFFNKIYQSNFTNCNLINSDFSDISLQSVSFKGSDLTGTTFEDAEMFEINLSQTKGLKSQTEFLYDNFEIVEEGIIVYKVFELYNTAPDDWQIEEGAVVSETVNHNRTEDCGCGVNVATMDWLNFHAEEREDIWKCLIRWQWFADVCVPYSSRGKIRAGKIELLELL